MRYDEFLARVRERGEYADQDEAATITKAVLGVLAQGMTPEKSMALPPNRPAHWDTCWPTPSSHSRRASG